MFRQGGGGSLYLHDVFYLAQHLIMDPGHLFCPQATESKCSTVPGCAENLKVAKSLGPCQPARANMGRCFFAKH